jgi:hypothetical protein
MTKERLPGPSVGSDLPFESPPCLSVSSHALICAVRIAILIIIISYMRRVWPYISLCRTNVAASSHVGEGAATISSACRASPFKRRCDLQQECFLGARRSPQVIVRTKCDE